MPLTRMPAAVNMAPMMIREGADCHGIASQMAAASAVEVRRVFG